MGEGLWRGVDMSAKPLAALQPGAGACVRLPGEKHVRTTRMYLACGVPPPPLPLPTPVYTNTDTQSDTYMLDADASINNPCRVDGLGRGWVRDGCIATSSEDALKKC
jgi:hypothetical protein